MREAVEEYGTALAQETSNNEILQERLVELELALEDAGWNRLGSEDDRQFTRAALKTINRTARLYWLKNPLIKRAVYTQTAYIFGQGVEIKATNPEIGDLIKEFMNDQKNQTELTSHQARMMKETELQLLANLYFVFFVNTSDGTTRIRTIPDDEIERVIYNPEDRKEPWYYLRVWKQPKKPGSSDVVDKSMLYPDYRYNPKTRPTSLSLDGKTIKIATEQVYHVKVNCLSDMDFGVSEVYAAIDWAKAYKEFLEDWATLVKALSKFAWRVTSKTGAKGVNAAKALFNSTVTADNPVDANNPPATGSMLIHGQGLDVAPITKSGTTTSVDDGRRMLLMVSAATGIFEHYFGDPSTGNLATAKSMERPMELMFKDRQTLWADVHVDILQYVVDQAILAPSGPIKGTADYNKYDERIVQIANDEDGKPIDRTIEVIFPDILEKDVAAKVEAIVKATTLAGGQAAGTIDLPTSTRLLLSALGVSDIEAIIKRLFPDSEDESWDDIDAKKTAKALKAQQVMAKAGLALGAVPAEDDEDENTSPKPPEAVPDEADAEEGRKHVTPTDGFLESIRKLDEQMAEMLATEDLDEGQNNNPTGINQYSKGRGGSGGSGGSSIADFKAGNDGLVRNRQGHVAGKVTKVKAEWGDGYVATMSGSAKHKAYTSKPHPNRPAAVKDIAQRAISQGW